LRKVIEALPKDKLIGIRNRALLVIGWAAALRRSELVGINIEDISKTRNGLIIYLNRSKTDQKGQGQDVALPYGSNPLTCPVRSFEDWITASGLMEGPLFRRIDRHGNIMGRLTPPTVRMVVKNSCETVGLDPKRYGAHSLRSGFCSQAARAGKAEYNVPQGLDTGSQK
jgi:site-specific recombinase XerD